MTANSDADRNFSILSLSVLRHRLFRCGGAKSRTRVVGYKCRAFLRRGARASTRNEKPSRRSHFPLTSRGVSLRGLVRAIGEDAVGARELNASSVSHTHDRAATVVDRPRSIEYYTLTVYERGALNSPLPAAHVKVWHARFTITISAPSAMSSPTSHNASSLFAVPADRFLVAFPRLLGPPHRKGTVEANAYFAEYPDPRWRPFLSSALRILRAAIIMSRREMSTPPRFTRLFSSTSSVTS